MRRKPHAYEIDCKRCGALLAPGQTFASCAKCRRVRYCGKECQAADWREHKKACGKRRASWWGKAPQGQSAGAVDVTCEAAVLALPEHLQHMFE
jgi:NAD(P)H-dependent flavin oxidoreductase YrpB (nitropropane dioxygenase family)